MKLDLAKANIIVDAALDTRESTQFEDQAALCCSSR
jgi:hypothetical protein